MLWRVPSEIGNVEVVTGFYGEWPAFHDAEVLRLALVRPVAFRSAPSTLELVIADVDRPAEIASVVTLRFSGVRDVKVDGFDEQNVLFDLELTPPEADYPRWKVVCSGSTDFVWEWTSDGVEVVSLEPLRRHS
jgi:Immunity protein 50